MHASQEGAVIAGSSAGAMVLCEHYYDPYEKQLFRGLNLLPNACVLPHHSTAGKRWAGMLAERLPDAVLIGIDERTGMLREGKAWSVYGEGDVTLYLPGPAKRRGRAYRSGESFEL